MSRHKLKKFKQLLQLPNIYQIEYPVVNKQKFLKFRDKKALTLEIGCGSASFSIQYAKKTKKPILAIDQKGDRILQGAKKALELKLPNLFFLRTNILALDIYFRKNIKNIWITFPDPFDRDKNAKHRLTHPIFLNIYRYITCKNHNIYLKTDNDKLFEFTLEILKNRQDQIVFFSKDIYKNKDKIEQKYPYVFFKTKYEQRFLQQEKTIKFIHFRLNS